MTGCNLPAGKSDSYMRILETENQRMDLRIIAFFKKHLS